MGPQRSLPPTPPPLTLTLTLLIITTPLISAGPLVQCLFSLDLYCVRLSNAAPFCKNHAKLSFDAKHLDREGWVNFLGCFFSKKCPFWPISNAAQNFQNMPCKL